MSDPVKQFQMECKEEIERQGADEFLRNASVEWMREAGKYKYSYHFTWMGRPIIQHPEDIVAMQELIWKVQPDVIEKRYESTLFSFENKICAMGGIR